MFERKFFRRDLSNLSMLENNGSVLTPSDQDNFTSELSRQVSEELCDSLETCVCLFSECDFSEKLGKLLMRSFKVDVSCRPMRTARSEDVLCLLILPIASLALYHSINILFISLLCCLSNLLISSCSKLSSVAFRRFADSFLLDVINVRLMTQD